MDGHIEFIKAYTAEHGYAPAMSEIASHAGCSKSTAWYRLKKLEEQGLITMVPGIGRTVRVTESVMKAPEEAL